MKVKSSNAQTVPTDRKMVGHTITKKVSVKADARDKKPIEYTIEINFGDSTLQDVLLLASRHVIIRHQNKLRNNPSLFKEVAKEGKIAIGSMEVAERGVFNPKSAITRLKKSGYSKKELLALIETLDK